MSRNAVLVLGLGMLLSLGVLAQGCDSTRKAGKDAAVDLGAPGFGGSTSDGGAIGTGGATGAGGMRGTGGATGAGGMRGTGGATGAGGGPGSDGGMILDGGIDGVSGRDTTLDSGSGADTRDAPITTDLPTDGSSEASAVDGSVDARSCPLYRPSTGSACDASLFYSGCTYYDSPTYPGGMVVCMCNGDKWSCYL